LTYENPKDEKEKVARRREGSHQSGSPVTQQ